MDISEVQEVVYKEFEQLEIPVSISIDHMIEPIKHESRGVILKIAWNCSKEEFEHFRPIVREVLQNHRPVYDPVHIVQDPTMSSMFSGPPRQEYVETYDCSFQLRVTGGNCDNFIKQFRDITKELRYQHESDAFDEEVEKMLKEEGEYNN